MEILLICKHLIINYNYKGGCHNRKIELFSVKFMQKIKKCTTIQREENISTGM